MKAFWLTTITGIFLLYSSCLRAQETFSATGGAAKGNGGTISFTAGQVAYTAIKSNSGTSAQGIQQPFEIFIITGREQPGIDLEIAVYPNPTSGFLNLNIEDYHSRKLIYRLFDINGSLLMIGEITEKQTVVPTGDLPPAPYYLKLSDDSMEIITYKIIKN